MSQTNVENPSKNASKNLGSAKEGTHHAILMRLSGLVLVPLSIWFALDFVPLITAERETIILWFANPLRLGLFLTFFILAAKHGVAGLQNVYDDYIHHPGLKFIVTAFTRYGTLAMIVILTLLLLRLHLGFVS